MTGMRRLGSVTSFLMHLDWAIVYSAVITLLKLKRCSVRMLGNYMGAAHPLGISEA